jgi:hypothetical protein
MSGSPLEPFEEGDPGTQENCQELIQPGNTEELLHSLVYKYMQFPNFLSM